MMGIDANILVRYVMQDDAVQSPKAAEVMERRLTEDDPGFISIVAMAETVWVLARTYSLSNVELAAAVERMLESDLLVVENAQEVWIAMTAVRDGRASFADALIAELGASAVCSRTLTFDRKAARLPGFELVS
jgi:predicted nucleic-acid-binding protein